MYYYYVIFLAPQIVFLSILLRNKLISIPMFIIWAAFFVWCCYVLMGRFKKIEDDINHLNSVIGWKDARGRIIEKGGITEILFSDNGLQNKIDNLIDQKKK